MRDTPYLSSLRRDALPHRVRVSLSGSRRCRSIVNHGTTADCPVCPACPFRPAVPQIKKIDLTQLAGTTLLIPSNAAASSFPVSSLSDPNKVKAIAGFHIFNTKYTLDDIITKTFNSVKSPDLLGPQTIFINRVTIPKKFLRPARTTARFGGSAAVASSNNGAAGLDTFFTGTYFNCIGVDKIVKQ